MAMRWGWMLVALASLPLAGLAWAVGASGAAAQAEEATEPPGLAEIAEMLGSGEYDQIMGAIEAAAMLGDPKVVILLDARIRAGLPPDLLGAAVGALGLLNTAEAGPILTDLSSHRRADVRVSALLGLVAVAPKTAAPTLLRALGDSNGEVRSAAASGLGEVGAVEAVPALFTAFERGVAGAGDALSKLAMPADLERIVGYMGALPFQSLSPLLSGLLQRTSWSDRDKLRIVAQVQELATTDARSFLESVVESAGVSGRVKRAAGDAAMRIAD